MIEFTIYFYKLGKAGKNAVPYIKNKLESSCGRRFHIYFKNQNCHTRCFCN